MKLKNLFVLSFNVFMAVFTIVSLFTGNHAQAGMSFAITIGGMYTSDMQAYRRILSKKMEKATWSPISFWGNFMGFIGSKSSYPESVNLGTGMTRFASPTGKPIEVLTNFQHEGGVHMDVPVMYPLTELPKYGDSQVLGTEEKRKIAYKKVAVNQVRKGVVVRDGAMSEAVLKKPEVQQQLMQGAQVELTDFNARWNAFQPYLALLERYSANLSATAALGGLAYTKQSHPNAFVAGAGRVAITNVNTIATYEADVATALGNLSDTSACHFSTNLIENAAFHATQLKIRPINIGADVVHYAMVISPAQAIQLYRDEKWLNAQQFAGVRDEKLNRLYNGQLIGVYRGVAIYIDVNSPSVKVTGDTGFTAANSTTGDATGIQYGADNYIANPIEASNKKVAILFGASCVACGYADPLKFESESWDYNNKKSEASRMIVGYERSDIYDNDGSFGTAGNFKENTSSLVLFTWSPDTPSWT